MKIHIIGGPGSGKTYLAEKLSKDLSLPHFDLDDVMWDNKSQNYGVKRDLSERDALFRQILSKDGWITEGVYYKWCGECFASADKIYLLDVPRKTYLRRIIRRFIRRKFGFEKGKKETLKSLFALLKWADKFETVNLPEIRKILDSYKEKVVDMT